VISTNELFAQIVEAAPGFRSTVEEHLADYDELLPHVLMADCSRLVASYFTGAPTIASGPPNERELQSVLSVLDRAMIEGDEATQNALAVSFVEHLWLQPYYPALYPFLGANIRAEIERQLAWESTDPN
jgi:hypothetical protein